MRTWLWRLLFVSLLCRVECDSATGNSSSGSLSIVIVYIVLFAFPLLCTGIGVLHTRGKVKRTVISYMLADRSLTGTVGTMVMISTWICTGYLFGSAESVVTSGRGLLWTQGPLGFSISFVMSSFLFCEQLREKDMITILDPMTEKFGVFITPLLYLPCLLGEVLWIGMLVHSLRCFVTIVLGFSSPLIVYYVIVCCIIVPAVGGLYSIKYSGLTEFAVIVLFLLVSVASLGSSPYVGDISAHRSSWLGTIEREEWGEWIDETLLIVFGGTCWQVYFQQMLSCRTIEASRVMSLFTGLGTFLIGLMACLFGVFASTIDWSQFGEIGSLAGNEENVVSYLVKYILPPLPRAISLAGIIATIMGSFSGAIHSSGSEFVLAIYKELIRRQASEREMLFVMRVFMVAISVAGVLLSLLMRSLYDYWVLTSDLIYVFVFPQLLLAIWLSKVVNTYGAFAAFFVTVLLRFGVGAQFVGVERVGVLPSWLPFRTLVVVVAMVVEVSVSVLFKFLIVRKGYSSLDCFEAFTPRRQIKKQEKEKRSKRASGN